MFKHYFCVILSLLFLTVVQSQEAIAIIDEIVIDGNKKTKERIILRELDFSINDTLQIVDFEQRVHFTRNRLLSTGLFNEVNIYFNKYNSKTHKCQLHIDVVENWYIYPSIIFELADRNFNVWWTDMNRSLDRVDYGLRLDYYNVTGNRDKLKLKLQGGYTRKYELDYLFPFVNNSQTIGIGSHIFYSDQKELPYITQGNKSVFGGATDGRKVLYRFRTGLALTYRPELYFNHLLSVEFHRNSVDTLVSNTLNPDYFLDGKSSIKFFTLDYNLIYNKLIFDVYPIGGYLAKFNIKKEGFGLFKDYNNLSSFVELQKHIPVVKNLTVSLRLKGKANLIRNKVAFANNTGLGYEEDVISGYDLYVLDGTDFVLGETQLKYRILNKTINLGDLMPINAFQKFNFSIFARWNTDIGYVNERHYAIGNDLNNRWLIGYGPALDILLYNTFLFNIEYTFNHLGEQGLYLRTTNSF